MSWNVDVNLDTLVKDAINFIALVLGGRILLLRLTHGLLKMAGT
jgi:hypothetical protein